MTGSPLIVYSPLSPNRQRNCSFWSCQNFGCQELTAVLWKVWGETDPSLVSWFGIKTLQTRYVYERSVVPACFERAWCGWWPSQVFEFQLFMPSCLSLIWGDQVWFGHLTLWQCNLEFLTWCLDELNNSAFLSTPKVCCLWECAQMPYFVIVIIMKDS